MMDIRRIREADEKVNSFIVFDEEGSIKKDAAKKGALAGLTVAVKSNMCVEGMPTSAALLLEAIAGHDPKIRLHSH